LHGTTGNAYDPARSAGGSSGGAAVALALHLLPVADGSDMMGAAQPGGLEQRLWPAPGLRPRAHAPAADVFYQQLATEGPMARNPQDLAWLLSTLAARRPRALVAARDPLQFRQPRAARPGAGASAGSGTSAATCPWSPGCWRFSAAGLAHFDTWAAWSPVSPGFDMAGLWRCWCTLRQLMLAGHLAALYADPASRALLKPEAVWEFEQSQRLDAAAVAEAFANPQRLVCGRAGAVRAPRLPGAAGGPVPPSMPSCTGPRRSRAARWTATTAGWRWSSALAGRFAHRRRAGRLRRRRAAPWPADHGPAAGRMAACSCARPGTRPRPGASGARRCCRHRRPEPARFIPVLPTDPPQKGRSPMTACL
jgi:hypothetical protein